MQFPHRQLVGLPPVHPEKQFHNQEVEPAGGDHNQQPAQGVNVFVADVILPAVAPAQQNQHKGHRRHSGMDCAYYEIGGKDGGMPGFDRYRHAEVPGNDAVHRYEYRQNQRRQQHAGNDLQFPLAGIALPAHRQYPINPVGNAGGMIAQHGKIRDQGNQDKQGAGSQIGQDGAGIPDQGRPNVGPDAAGKIVGKGPIQDTPRPPGMDDGHKHGRHQGEQGQHFGGPGSRPPPFGFSQPQDGRQHYAGVADANPEHEVGDEKAPGHRPVQAGDAQTPVHHYADGDGRDQQNQPQDGHHRPEPPRRIQDGPEQIPVDLARAEDSAFLHGCPFSA